MRKPFLNLVGAAVLGMGVLLGAQAQAAPASTLGQAVAVMNDAQGDFETIQYRGDRHYRGPGHRRGPGYYGHPGYRPGYRGPGRRCWVERRRVWNGYRWIARSIRVCR